jgi:hypothetical protein
MMTVGVLRALLRGPTLSNARAISSTVTFGLSEEQTAIVEAARAFSRDKLSPHSAEWDRTSHFPVDVLKEAAELGLAGLYCAEEYGGAGEQSSPLAPRVSTRLPTEHGPSQCMMQPARSCACQRPAPSPHTRGARTCAGLARLDGALVFEALAYGDVPTTAFLTIHNMVAAQLNRWEACAPPLTFSPATLLPCSPPPLPTLPGWSQGTRGSALCLHAAAV